jgi:hypothetical protein
MSATANTALMTNCTRGIFVVFQVGRLAAAILALVACSQSRNFDWRQLANDSYGHGHTTVKIVPGLPTTALLNLTEKV